MVEIFHIFDQWSIYIYAICNYKLKIVQILFLERSLSWCNTYNMDVESKSKYIVQVTGTGSML